MYKCLISILLAALVERPFLVRERHQQFIVDSKARRLETVETTTDRLEGIMAAAEWAVVRWPRIKAPVLLDARRLAAIVAQV